MADAEGIDLYADVDDFGQASSVRTYTYLTCSIQHECCFGDRAPFSLAIPCLGSLWYRCKSVI